MMPTRKPPLFKVDLPALLAGDMNVSLDRIMALPAPGLGVVALLLKATLSQEDFDPRPYEEWQAWWANAPAPAKPSTRLPGTGADRPLFALRQTVRDLDQNSRVWAEVGLNRGFRLRPTEAGPLQDDGLLARAAGINWTQGVAATLDKMAHLPADQACAVFCAAFTHAVCIDAAQGSAQLMQWASRQNWSASTQLPNAKILAQAWQLWSAADFKGADAVFASSLTLYGNQAFPPDQERAFWAELVGSDTPVLAASALDKWCGYHPGSWERVHSAALGDPSAPRAFMLACDQADRHGLNTPLWQALSNAPSTRHWIHHLGWGEEPTASPLVAWWVRRLSGEEGVLDEKTLATLGQDEVSNALRHLGANEPGCARDRASGACCFAAALVVPPVSPSLLLPFKNLVYDHPQTGSNPIATAKHFARAKGWIECGFDPSAVDHAGNQAFATFLWGEARLSKGNAQREMAGAFATGRLPVQGECAAGSLVHCVMLYGKDVVRGAWLGKRLENAAPFQPHETQWCAQGLRAFELLDWIKALETRNVLTLEHQAALWQSACFRDRKEDKECWDEIAARCPFVEDPLRPLWVSLLERWEANTLDVTLSCASIAIWALPATRPRADHPAWQSPLIVKAWADIIELALAEPAKSLADWVPADTSPSWWARSFSLWSLHGRNRDEAEVLSWLAAGLPLAHPEVLEVVATLRQEQINNQLPGQDPPSPWWGHPSIVAELAHHDLAQDTHASPSARAVRRM